MHIILDARRPRWYFSHLRLMKIAQTSSIVGVRERLTQLHPVRHSADVD